MNAEVRTHERGNAMLEQRQVLELGLLKGLKVNDPTVQQYQIWIFDAARDKRYPVDGGLFDVPMDSSELIVPIHAALPVQVAKAFAVTLENPGGVVVSALHHVVVLGAAG